MKYLFELVPISRRDNHMSPPKTATIFSLSFKSALRVQKYWARSVDYGATNRQCLATTVSPLNQNTVKSVGLGSQKKRAGGVVVACVCLNYGKTVAGGEEGCNLDCGKRLTEEAE